MVCRRCDRGRGRFDGEEENNMDLRAPSVLIFVVSLVFAALALIGHVVLLPFVTLYGFWVAIIAYLILAIGVVMRTWRLWTSAPAKVWSRRFS